MERQREQRQRPRRMGRMGGRHTAHRNRPRPVVRGHGLGARHVLLQVRHRRRVDHGQRQPLHRVLWSDGELRGPRGQRHAPNVQRHHRRRRADRVVACRHLGRGPIGHADRLSRSRVGRDHVDVDARPCRLRRGQAHAAPRRKRRRRRDGGGSSAALLARGGRRLRLGRRADLHADDRPVRQRQRQQRSRALAQRGPRGRLDGR